MQQITNKQMANKKYQMTNDKWQITNKKPDGWIELDEPYDPNEKGGLIRMGRQSQMIQMSRMGGLSQMGGWRE